MKSLVKGIFIKLAVQTRALTPYQRPALWDCSELWLCGMPKHLACRSPAEGAALGTAIGST
jgi:hypothetical protein